MPMVATVAIVEALMPTGSVPGPVEWLRSVPARWRRSRRYAGILRLVLRHGLGRYLTPRRLSADHQPASATARALRDALIEGGATFVKLGQMLSTRGDLLPAAYVAELSTLHAQVPPQPWDVVSRTLTAELGRPPDKVFAEIDSEPLAAASVGQAHRAQLMDGRTVVVKVQRSDARAQVSADLDIIRRLAERLQLRRGLAPSALPPWSRVSLSRWPRSWTTWSRPVTPTPSGPDSSQTVWSGCRWCITS